MENDNSGNTAVNNRPIRGSPPIAPRTSGITNSPAIANQSVNATPPLQSQSDIQEDTFIPHIVLEPKSDPNDIIEQKSDVDITPEISHGVPSVELEPASGINPNVSMVDVRPAVKSTPVGYESKTEAVTGVGNLNATQTINMPTNIDPVAVKTNSSRKFALTAKIAVVVIVVGLLIVSGIWFVTNI